MDAKAPKFEDFWKKYPPRWQERAKVWKKSDRFYAEIEWMKLSDKEKVAAVGTVGSVERGEFTPDARKWLKHKMWQDEITKPSSSPPVQRFRCAICPEPEHSGRGRYDKQGKYIPLCRDCDRAARFMGSYINRRISLAELERKIEQGKAKMQKRSTPEPKDPELVAADKKQAAIRKLVKETADDFGKGGQ